MDNTLKLLISVLSIAGLIAFLTPAPSEDPTITTEAANAAAAPAAAMPDKVGEPEIVASEESEDEDLLSGFGEPMNDGNPIDPVKDDSADTSDGANDGQPTNDTTPQFSPPSDSPAPAAVTGNAGGGSTVTGPALTRTPAPPANAVANGKPIPGAPPVTRARQN